MTENTNNTNQQKTTMKTLLLSLIFTAVACLGAYKLGFNHAEQLFAWYPVQQR